MAQLEAVLQAWAAAQAAAHRECTDRDAPVVPPPGRRLAVLVAGLGSTSESAAIDDVDTGALGYADADVLRFSYAGGRTPDPRDGFGPSRPPSYDASATQADLRASASRLADLVEQIDRSSPASRSTSTPTRRAGLVARLALIELVRRHGEAWVARLGLVATLGTPHGGADLATAVYAVGSTMAGSAAIDAARETFELQLDDDAPSSAQLAETSDVVAELADAPVPAGVDAVSIAARGDLVVPVPRSRAPGATQVVVPVDGLHAHDALPGQP